MDNFPAAPAHDERGFAGDPHPSDAAAANGDDNLGDEAAFPPTWLRLAAGDARHD